MNVVIQTLPECFARVQELLASVGATVVEIPSSFRNGLGLEVLRNGTQWKISVNCNWPPYTRLPAVHLMENHQLLAHVAFNGLVCVNDSESLSIDLSRHADTVAQTVLAALNLLEHSLDDTKHGYVEFCNELEGYWGGLPNIGQGKTTVEVDEQSRAIKSYFKADEETSAWYFLEESAAEPTEFPKIDGPTHRSVYMALPQPVLPPAVFSPLTTEYLQTLVDEFDPAQEALWATLVGNSPEDEQVTLLVSMPRAAGGRSLLGFVFNVVNGRPNPAAPFRGLLMVRHTVSHMRERGGADLSMGKRHVVIFGCGSVGSEVADALASSGVGKLTLVDPQELTSDNVFRHALGRFWVGSGKAPALRATLLLRYAGLEIVTSSDTAHDWLETNTGKNIDGFVVALGMPTLERQLGRALRTSYPNTAVLHTWLEPLDLGGHAVLVNTSEQGCLDCLYRDDEGVDSLSCRTSYLEPGQTLTRNLTGCASTFTPYGAIQSRRTALLAAEQMLKALSTAESPRYAYWAGDGTAAVAHGLRLTPWWQRAKSNGSLDMTRAMFGSPCIHCRGAK